jgi:hypothetical protein
MLSREASGNNDKNQIIELAQLIGANPWVKLNSIIGVSPRHSRSLVERQVLRLVESIGPDRHFCLAEVVELLNVMVGKSTGIERLLVAPADLLDFIPADQGVRAIPTYLEEILRKAQHEVLLLAPFWDMSTLIDLLRCVPRETTKAELVLLLGHMGRRLPRVGTIVNKVQSVWPLARIRIYIHLANRGSSTKYPHAKCLVVDRNHGYLGSANFTGAGMKGHFEVGVCLEPEDSRTLGGILQYLWSQSGLFALAWDSAESSTRT